MTKKKHPDSSSRGWSRRSFLTRVPAGVAGLTAGTALWTRLVQKAASQDIPVQRLIVWYTADGTVPDFFFPASAGALTIRGDRTNDLSGRDFNTAIPEADRPTFILQPISRYSDRVLMTRGIRNPGTADHAPAVQSCLTGDAVGSTVTSGPSLDVLVSEAQVRSTHIEPVLRTGVYGNRVSYNGTRDVSRPRGGRYVEPSWQPVADARRVLDAVGTGGVPIETGPDVERLRRIAVLGSARERIEALRCAAGTPAAHRLEAYAEEVARLERLELEMRDPEPTSFESLVNPDDPAMGAAQGDIRSLSQIAPFVTDLAVTALALDYSPVVTMQWGASGQNNISDGRLTDYRYDFMLPQLEYPGAGDHGLAHPEDGAFSNAGHRITAAVSTRDRVRIQRWFYGQLAHLLDRLSAVPEGTGTLFDNTTIVCVSEFGGPRANSTAGQHSLQNLPYTVIAGRNTPFRTGQSLVLDRTHGDYLLTIARALGSTESRMGVGNSTIPEMLR